MTIGYDMLLNKANIFLVREALKLVSGTCNLYISFYTNKKGVDISPQLRKEYPEKMAVILQHQFTNLTVNNNDFSIQLSFNNVLETIKIPLSSIEIFHDRDANFYLKLEELSSDSHGTIPSFEDKLEEEDKIISIDKFLNK